MSTSALAIVPVVLLVAAFSACGDSGAPGPVARTCALAQPAPSDSRLRTDGTRFRDALDRIVVLRGVNGGGRSKFAPFMPFDYPPDGFDAALAQYMDRAASWGINAMRVPFTWAAVEPVQGVDDEDFLRRYDAFLDAAWAHGIRTVVDFHQDVYSEAFCGDGFPAWTIPAPVPALHHDCPQWSLEYFGNADVEAAFDRLWADGSPVQASLVSMWDRMVARYKDKPGVVGFEVINEPAAGTAKLDAFSATTLTAFYTLMASRMRAAAPGALVFVDPLGIDGVSLATSLARPAGDGIVFAPHFYPFSHDPDRVISYMMNWVTVGSTWNVPTFVGEFGGANSDAELPFATAHFDAFDTLGLSGTEWEYSVAAEGWNSETASIVGADGTEHAIAGAVVRPFARAVAGEAITTSFDATSRRFTLAFAPTTSGVTEVSVPARAYAGGFDVDLSGACVDRSHPGELLVQADPGAAQVELRVTAR